ncbi:MAG: NAD(P)-dependent oxidoreductase [Kiritimatiellia bacterium]
MNSSNNRVLLTGATGLIGKELIAPLKSAGFEIYAITIDETNLTNGVHWIKGDLFDETFVARTVADVKPYYLLNMAWATTGDYLASNINYNFLAAGIHLIQQFAKNGGERAVFAGTCFEYAFREAPLKEDETLDPNKTTYTFCKHQLHEITARFCQSNDISLGYGRIFYVYGNGESKTRLTGMLIDKLSNNEEITIKSGPLIKDYIYAKDIANAFVRLLDSNVQGAVNICTGKGIRIGDYARAIAKALNKEPLLKFTDDCAGQPAVIVGDNTRLTTEVGYTIQYDLETALKEIL